MKEIGSRAYNNFVTKVTNLLLPTPPNPDLRTKPTPHIYHTLQTSSKNSIVRQRNCTNTTYHSLAHFQLNVSNAIEQQPRTPHHCHATVVVNTATRHAQIYQKHSQTKPQSKPLGGPARSVTEIDLTISEKLEAQPSRLHIWTTETTLQASVSFSGTPMV